jgi:hypothetical protein
MNCRAPLVGEPRALTLRQPDAPVHALIFGPHLVGAPVTLHVRRHETEQNAAPHAYHFTPARGDCHFRNQRGGSE